jgi:replicative DNA helicase
MTAPAQLQDLAAERAVLSACLAQPGRIAEVATLIRADDLSLEAHQLLFGALLDFDSRGAALDPLTLAELLRTRGQLHRVGGVAYLAELDTAAPMAANAKEYARIVAEHGARRRALAVLSPAVQQLSSGLGEPADAVAAVQLGLLEVEEKRAQGDLKPFSATLESTLDLLDQLRDRRGGVTGLATGYPDLDRMLTGLHPGELVILAARPGVGKSALALNVAGHVALRERKPVAVFSLEMPQNQLGLRLLASEGRVSLKRLREGGLSDSDYTRINDTSANLHSAPIFIDDSGTLTPFDVRARCRRLKRRHPQLALVVIDYLQLMAAAGRAQNREQEVAQCSRALKQLAKELDLPVLALSQLSRKVEERRGGRPMLSDLRESGSLEQDSDVVLFIHPEEHSEDEPADGARPSSLPVELIVAKQRNGPTGVVSLQLRQEWTRFESRTFPSPRSTS